MDSPKLEAEPFLGSDLEKSGKSHYTPSHHTFTQTSHITRRSIAIHTAIALCYTALITALALIWANSKKCQNPEPLLYSPARPAITHEVRDLTSGVLSGNPYVGAARPELDKAWDDLLQNSYIHVSTPEYTRLALNRSTLELADGSGHVLSLGIYHSLHCLKQVHKWIHREEYDERLSDAQFEERRWHIEHCIEHLRQATLCAGDTTPITFDWLEVEVGRPLPHPVALYRSECVAWEPLDAWAAARRVDLFRLDTIRGMPGRGW
ncbi:hypothetical protein AOQ84DRAFT_388408 [Glonium stellatum]|uniref:Cyclochlorotine biosynthesis protein O n=1 Tax=Glonium stellatum TaxID=574774 RepID=A0A8E2JTH4_9PEZI|nr:hypothetical protein AOQ84DRAFT_388408 [Glonium stellatum]